jgi:formiminoglutamate deiminase
LSYWCELAWLGGEAPESNVLLAVNGDSFADVEIGVDAPPGVTRLAGLTLPGFANAHSHAFHRALRGRTHGGRGSFWTWREQMYSVAATLDPDAYFRLARATYAEMALAGITAVGEFHYLHHEAGGHPYNDPNEMGRALIAAANEAGIHMTLLDTCYLHGGFDQPPDEVQQRFSDGDADTWAERVAMLAADPDAEIGAAIHSVRAVDPASCATVASWAAGDGRPLHAHVSEQPAENQACLAAHGQTPTGLLAEAGALGPRFTAVHATHVTDGDVELLGGAGCCCCLCPTTERDLADGVGPARALIDAGASLSLGSDSHAVIDMLEEARAVELDERLASGERGHHNAASLLRAATSGGHAAIGRDGGWLKAGAPADLVTIDLDSVRLAGVTPESALESAVFAATAADVREVVVGGRQVVSDGRHADLDVAAELRAAIAEVRSPAD